MEHFIEELKIINELYPDTFTYLVISSYILGSLCPLADGIAFRLGISVRELFEKKNKK